MTITTDEQTSQTATEKPKGTTKASSRARKPDVSPAKAKAKKKATSPKNRAKAAKGANAAKNQSGARQESKTQKVLELLKRDGGVSLKEIMKATDWQAHSVRGFLSGTVGKKMGLAVTSTKAEDGERNYSIQA